MNESLVRAGKTARGAFDVIVKRPECRELAEGGNKIPVHAQTALHGGNAR